MDNYQSTFRNFLYLLNAPREYNRELINELQKFLIALCETIDKQTALKRDCEYTLQEIDKIPFHPSIFKEKFEQGAILTTRITELDNDINTNIELKRVIEDVISNFYNNPKIELISTDDKLLSMWKDGYTAVEIGETLGFAPGTIRNRITKLRKELGSGSVPYH